MDTKTTRITIVITERQLGALRAQAKREKRAYSSIIREALEKYLGVPDTVQLGGVREDEENDGDLLGAYAH